MTTFRQPTHTQSLSFCYLYLQMNSNAFICFKWMENTHNKWSSHAKQHVMNIGSTRSVLVNWQTLIFVYLATDNVGQLNQNYGRRVNDSSVLLCSLKENLLVIFQNKVFMLCLGTAEPVSFYKLVSSFTQRLNRWHLVVVVSQQIPTDSLRETWP